MKIHFIQRYHGPEEAIAGAAAGGGNPVSAGLAALQGALATIQTIVGSARAKKLMAQRTAYKTPEEVFKILNATLNMAGGDTITRDFQTNQIDKGFSQVLGNATRLGADPNDLSALFDQKINGLLNVGQQFHASNMEAFGKVMSAYDLVAQNKVAEWRSKEDILKDKIAAAVGDKQAGIQNLGSAANAAISLSSSGKTSNLYTQIADALKALKSKGVTAAGTNEVDNSFYEMVSNAALGLNN